MPKTWDEGHEWIMNQKQAYDTNYENLRVRVEKEDKTQEKGLKDHDSKIASEKLELLNANASIAEEETKMQENSEVLQKEIDDYQHQYQKYTNKIEKAKKEISDNENKIYTSGEIIKSNEEIMNKNTKVAEQIEATSKLANDKIALIPSKQTQDDHKDLVNRLSFTEKQIKGYQGTLEVHYSSMNQNLKDQKTSSENEVNEVSKLHTSIIKGCQSMNDKSTLKLREIYKIWEEIENSQIPKFDKSEFDKNLEDRDNALKKLNKTKSDYMELTKVLSEIHKDKQLYKCYEVSWVRYFINAILLI